MELPGTIRAYRISHLKFQIGGKLSSVNCRVGDTIKKGQLLATIDKKELQAYLDRALKEYDLERALFDEKQKLQLTEYEKRKYQDSLDISVKNVEIAKANLDATDLYSSINGIAIEMDQAQSGDNITPAGFIIMVVDPQTLYFEAELPEENIASVSVGQPVKIELISFPDRIIDGKIERISFAASDKGRFSVQMSLADLSNLRLGLSGEAII